MIGILLAAGFSRRFGNQDKLLQPLPDGTAIALAAARNLISALPTCLAVVRPHNTALADALRSLGLHVVFCSNEAKDMAESLVCAVRHAAQFTNQHNGYVIALGDMPYIQTATISAVAASLSAGAQIVIPSYQGKNGHPVGFAAKFCEELMHLNGDEGARAVIKRHASVVEIIACDDPGILADIDTPTDLAGINS